MKDSDAQFEKSSANDFYSGQHAFAAPGIKLLLTEAEAARALGISRRTLWTLRNEGKIPFLRIGKCIRYSLVALQEWVKRHQASDAPKLPE